MAMENKRITQLSTERLTLTSGDYVLVDDANNGSAKYRLDKLKETDSTLSVSDMAANAAATGSAISDEATARELADTAIGEDIDDLKSAISLHDDEIDNTVQTITFASDGSVQKIEHKRDNVIIRTDTFTFTANTITEVRTLNTGESLAIVTNLQTLETVVTYATA